MATQGKDYDHINDMLLPYLEGLLDQEDRALVEKRISESSDLADKKRELEQTLRRLSENKEALCPNPVELFDYSRGVSESAKSIEIHLNNCEECKNLVQEFQASKDTVTMPESVKKAFNERFKVEEAGGASQVESHSISVGGILEKVRSFLQFPTLALASVAAAMLAVIMIYPFSQEKIYPALSDVSWKESDQRFRIMGAHSKTIWPKAAILIVFKDFETPPSQEEINALYKSIRPSAKLRKQLTILDPSDVKKAIESSRTSPSSTKEIVKLLKDKLSIKKALFVDISAKGDAYKVTAYAMDSTSLKKGSSSTSKAMSSSDLDRAVKEALNELDLNQD